MVCLFFSVHFWEATACSQFPRSFIWVPNWSETGSEWEVQWICRGFMLCCYCGICLQCFDTVGWVSGRASGLWKLSDEVLVWLYVGSEVQIACIWYSCCHFHTQTPSSLASFKSSLVLPFWYGLPRLSWKRGRLVGVVVVVTVVFVTIVSTQCLTLLVEKQKEAPIV